MQKRPCLTRQDVNFHLFSLENYELHLHLKYRCIFGPRNAGKYVHGVSLIFFSIIQLLVVNILMKNKDSVKDEWEFFKHSP